MTPTARSLAVLREMNYVVQVVEQYNRFSKTRHDLYGCIDVLAVHPEYGILGVQATTTSNAAARQTKVAGRAPARDVAPGRWEVRGSRLGEEGTGWQAQALDGVPAAGQSQPDGCRKTPEQEPQHRRGRAPGQQVVGQLLQQPAHHRAPSLSAWIRSAWKVFQSSLR